MIWPMVPGLDKTTKTWRLKDLMLQAWVVGGRCHIMTSLIILDRVIQHERRFDKVCMGFNLPLTSPFAGRVLMVFGPVFFLLLSPRSQRQNDHTCHTY